MEKLVRSCDKEYMKMAMLKHEETFKEQVYELHRLYRIQKILMKNMEARRGIEVNQQEWHLNNAISLSPTNGHHKGSHAKPQMKFDLERPAEEHIAESDIIQETEIELTLGPSSYYNNRRKKVHETPLTSESGHSLSSSSTGSSNVNKTREESSGSIIGLVQVPDSTSGFQSGIRNSFGIEEQLRQERLNQPPWLFQVLNLNMT